MKVSGPIIMQRFSISHLVSEDELYESMDITDEQYGSIVAYNVDWSERRGGTEILCSEFWSPIAPNIFRVIPPRK